MQEKHNYYIKHQTEKKLGFELHHIIALEYADCPALYTLLDRWENMVYIDAFSHAKVTQNRNRNVILGVIKNNLTLTDYSKNKVYLKYKENIFYNPANKEKMKNYNQDLLNTIK